MLKRGRYMGSMYGRYKRSARMRRIEWQLTREEFAAIALRECHYCGEPPATRFFNSWVKHKAQSVRIESTERLNGIDRVDNASGYVAGNCVAACKRCNRLKMDMSLSEMLELITKILNRSRAA